ncbi:transposase [bacterium]|nr:transposase [bacterium]
MLQRHNKLAFSGSIHFVTTVTSVRGNWFVETLLCQQLLELFEGYRVQTGIDCLGYVLMPDHLHALLHQTTDEPVVSKMMNGFKSVSSRNYRPTDYPQHNLWRQHFDDVPIPGRDAAVTRLEYMLNNPIRKALVEKPEDYLWSSARQLLLGESGIVTLMQI